MQRQGQFDFRYSFHQCKLRLITTIYVARHSHLLSSGGGALPQCEDEPVQHEIVLLVTKCRKPGYLSVPTSPESKLTRHAGCTSSLCCHDSNSRETAVAPSTWLVYAQHLLPTTTFSNPTETPVLRSTRETHMFQVNNQRLT